MKLEHLHPVHLTVYVAGTLLFVVSLIWLFQGINVKDEVTNWRMEIVHENDIRTGHAVNIQLFLEDEVGMPIEDAEVNIIMDRPKTVHNIEKVMYHLEAGLYESAVVFSLPGTWIGMVEVTRGNQIYKNQFLLQVEGPVIAKQNRDPSDAFNFKQPLPLDVKRELQAFPVSTE